MIIDTSALSLSPTNFRRQSYPNFGRWVYLTPANPATNTILNFVQYDAGATANGKKKVNTFQLTGASHTILAVSPAMDCIITRQGTDVIITQIVPGGSTDALTFVPA